MNVEPYLFFEGRCDEAIEFYRKALGAELTMLMRFKEGPDPSALQPGTEDKVMHANLVIGDTTVMVSDGRCTGKAAFQGFSLTISVNDKGEAKSLFDGLCDGGEVMMPLSETFWSPCFGMVTDRFGVSWMISASPAAK